MRCLLVVLWHACVSHGVGGGGHLEVTFHLALHSYRQTIRLFRVDASPHTNNDTKDRVRCMNTQGEEEVEENTENPGPSLGCRPRSTGVCPAKGM